jgi:hypothetical protein
LQFSLFISFFDFFFFYNLFLGICNFWQPYFDFLIFLGFFFLLFWFFKYVIGSIILIRFCTGSYNSSFELCFNLWLHITASLGLICCSHGSQQAFQLQHESYSNINLDYKIFCAAPASYSFCPTSSMPCLWANLGNIYVDISENNSTTKNVGCKIYIVVEITL